MKHKMILLSTVMLLMAACVGCGNQTHNLPQKPTSQVNNELPNEKGQTENVPNTNISGDSEGKNPANGDDLFAISKLNGTVVEFSDNGCQITPSHYENVGEGEVAYEAAPGHEDQEELITVTYDENCVFQIAYVNIQTGAVTYDTANVSDIKKQTRLVICGEYDSDYILHASRVFIYRNME